MTSGVNWQATGMLLRTLKPMGMNWMSGAGKAGRSVGLAIFAHPLVPQLN
jgi:hypothetical protein